MPLYLLKTTDLNIVKIVGTQLYNVSETVNLSKTHKIYVMFSTKSLHVNCNPSKSCKYKRI